MTARQLAFDDARSSAWFSPCRTERYALYRTWDTSKPRLVSIGLNPSDADEKDNDPTIRREIGFAQRWGMGGLVKLNLFPQITPFPKDLPTLHARKLPGDTNDAAIVAETEPMRGSGIILACWGANKYAQSWARRLVEIVIPHTPMRCLGLNKDGSPEHPLYIPYERPLKPYGRST